MTTKYELFTPFYEIVIHKGPLPFPLKIKGDPLPQEITEKIKSFSYEDSSGESKQSQLKLVITNQNGEFTDIDWFQEGNIIKVVWGYVGEIVSPERRFIIGSIDYDFAGKDPEMTVTCKDLSALLVYHRRRTWPQATVSTVAGLIANEYNLVAKVEILPEIFKQLNQGNISDARYLLQLAKQNGCLFFVRDKELHLHKPNLARHPIMTLRYFTDLRGELKRFHSISETADREDVETEAPGFNKMEKHPTNVKASDGESPTDTIGTHYVDMKGTFEDWVKNPKNPREITGAAHASPDDNEYQSKFLADAKRAETESKYVRANVDCIGIPYLISDAMITIDGDALGDKFRGNWYIRSATHTIDGRGYLCKLGLIRQGTGQEIQTKPRQSREKDSGKGPTDPLKPRDTEWLGSGVGP